MQADAFTLTVEDYKRRARSTRSERPVQRAVIDFLELHPNIAWVRRMNSGGAYSIPVTEGHTLMVMIQPGAKKHKSLWFRVRNWIRQFRWVRFGFKGCPDVWAMTKQGRLVVVETKGKGDTVHDDQAHFLQICDACGAIAFVMHDVTQLDELDTLIAEVA